MVVGNLLIFCLNFWWVSFFVDDSRLEQHHDWCVEGWLVLNFEFLQELSNFSRLKAVSLEVQHNTQLIVVQDENMLDLVLKMGKNDRSSVVEDPGNFSIG